MRVAALCAGYGGLELGLQMAGVDVDLAWYAEIDKHAASVMAHHHPQVPNLGDLTEITDPPPVDVMTAGFPCQPVSTAGKRKGVNDDRWLINDVCEVARRADARWLLLENVPGIFTANRGEAFYQVLAALAENGFAAEWTVVRASDVGAPHQRRRWFCVAHANQPGGEAWGDAGHDSEVFRQEPVGPAASASDASVLGRQAGPRSSESKQGRIGWDGSDHDSRATAADAELQGSQGWDHTEKLGCDDPVHGRGRGIKTSRCREATTASDVPRRTEQRGTVAVQAQLTAVERVSDDAGRWGPYAAAVARWEPVVGRPAPDPTDDKRRLNPRFVEWMMGLPDGHVTDAVEGRSHQLKILGNGVVPQQAAYAIRLLADQAVAS